MRFSIISSYSLSQNRTYSALMAKKATRVPTKIRSFMRINCRQRTNLNNQEMGKNHEEVVRAPEATGLTHGKHQNQEEIQEASQAAAVKRLAIYLETRVRFPSPAPVRSVVTTRCSGFSFSFHFCDPSASLHPLLHSVSQ